MRGPRGVNRAFSGLANLVLPDGRMTPEDARLSLRLAIELRLRVQLHHISRQEFLLTELSSGDR